MKTYEEGKPGFLLRIIGLLILHVGCVLSGICFEYLVAGPSGVPSAFSAFGTSSGRYTSPKMAYLYQPYLGNRYYANAWCGGANTEDKWLQIDLKKDMLIKSVVTRGSPNSDRVTYQSFVTNFTLSYKVDGGDWVAITDDKGKKYFHGNTHWLQTLFHPLETILTARYVRFYPVEWHNRPCVQLGLIGCPIETLEPEKERFWRASLYKVLETNEGLLFDQNSDHHAFCAKRCFGNLTCLSFVFDYENKRCRAYNLQLTENPNPNPTSNVVFFKRMYSTCDNGYEKWFAAPVCYRVYLFGSHAEQARIVCRQEGGYIARLNSLDVRNKTWLETRKNRVVVISNSFHVAGMFDGSGGIWKFENGQEIETEVWATGYPNITFGNCAYLTVNGLQNGNCSSPRWFICTRDLK